MKYYEGIDFALADVQFGSRNCKRTYPFYCGLQLVYAGEIALAVDRDLFSAEVTRMVESHPRIEVRREEVRDLSLAREGLLLVAINRANTIYFTNLYHWDEIVQRDMAKDVSWQNSARQYKDLYLELTPW